VWILVWALAGMAAAKPAQVDIGWKPLAPGVEYAAVERKEAMSIDSRIHVVRIDPARAPLQAVMAGASDGKTRTAAEWCRTRRLAVAINMGMYRDDQRTNAGHAHAPGYVNNAGWTPTYKVAIGFGAHGHDVPAVMMADLDDPAQKQRLTAYGTVIQNLRLIRSPGRNVWTKADRRWSEAAVAIDKHGRVLFIFTRYPHAMKELNDILLAMPLDLDTAMHVEGGPEASLSIHAGGVSLDLGGSYETGFNENDGERTQWPIPNVLGVAASR
jgi:hypothetical protein